MDTYECRKEDGLWKAKVDTLGADFSYLNPQGCF
jgi:hypothetical protein